MPKLAHLMREKANLQIKLAWTERTFKVEIDKLKKQNQTLLALLEEKIKELAVYKGEEEKQLIEQFKEETGKNAIYGKKETKAFIKWKGERK